MSRAATPFLGPKLARMGQVREALACVVDYADRAGGGEPQPGSGITSRKLLPPRKRRVDLNQAITYVLAFGRKAQSVGKWSLGPKPALRRDWSDVRRMCSTATCRPELDLERLWEAM